VTAVEDGVLEEFWFGLASGTGGGEIGDPCGVPTETGAGRLGEPWKTRVQDLWDRKDKTQSTM